MLIAIHIFSRRWGNNNTNHFNCGEKEMPNHLKNQTSPYLLQHADNPVDWYPWCDEAFERAKREDKPVFLSIGYSTCHWCHVMAYESFEDTQVAEILNQYFISIKVDKEERPDIDSIYMSVCQAFTGSGGWPTTIFLTPDQKPFFAGTYFPKTAKFGQPGLVELLLAIHKKWEKDREKLLRTSDEVVSVLNRQMYDEESLSQDKLSNKGNVHGIRELPDDAAIQLLKNAVSNYKHAFDKKYGGFGNAPKFPTPHNLLFLMKQYEKYADKECMEMVEKTLMQMYRGGIFDHIGGGFSRYSTDQYFLVPHFEKMLYDNALLILAYCKGYQLTKNRIFVLVAERCAEYILREMKSSDGGFYSAQDADSEGVEGKYYLFEPSEIIDVLGRTAGKEFNEYFDITAAGNFEGKSIPNLLRHSVIKENINIYLSDIYQYRKKRYALHLDDKILTSWNGLMIAAMCHLYRVTRNKKYLNAAIGAQNFIQIKLCEKDTLYVSYRSGNRSKEGFLDDYANEIFALLALYEATMDCVFLGKAECFCKKAVKEFFDDECGGFFLYGKDSEQLILRPKETYDGAMPSGNSMMAYNLVRLYLITGEAYYKELSERQLDFMGREAIHYPAGHSMFLMALSDYMDLPEKITVVLKDKKELQDLSCMIPLYAIVTVLERPTKEYPLLNDKTTYYVCKGHSCQPPVNEL